MNLSVFDSTTCYTCGDTVSRSKAQPGLFGDMFCLYCYERMGGKREEEHTGRWAALAIVAILGVVISWLYLIALTVMAVMK